METLYLKKNKKTLYKLLEEITLKKQLRIKKKKDIKKSGQSNKKMPKLLEKQ